MGANAGSAGSFSIRVNGINTVHFTTALQPKEWHSTDGKVGMSYLTMEDGAHESNGIARRWSTVDGSLLVLAPGKPVTFEVSGATPNSQSWFGVYLLE